MVSGPKHADQTVTSRPAAAQPGSRILVAPRRKKSKPKGSLQSGPNPTQQYLLPTPVSNFPAFTLAFPFSLYLHQPALSQVAPSPKGEGFKRTQPRKPPLHQPRIEPARVPESRYGDPFTDAVALTPDLMLAGVLGVDFAQILGVISRGLEGICGQYVRSSF